MAHVFCDAPHVNENVLYKDYYDWFYNTIKCLSQNANINLLVKEHPSSYLFKENGIVDSVMQDFNLVDRIITSDESTYSILNNADMVVTCGGTIGLEFSSLVNLFYWLLDRLIRNLVLLLIRRIVWNMKINCVQLTIL